LPPAHRLARINYPPRDDRGGAEMAILVCRDITARTV